MPPTYPTYPDYPVCPACGQPTDYCPGHGDIGDPYGAKILQRHGQGDHSSCHPNCDRDD